MGEREPMSKVHPTAIVEPGAQIGAGASVGPYCVIEAGAVIGERAEIAAHVVIRGKTKLGEDCKVHPFVSLGGPPQHLGYKGEEVSLEIGARSVLREHVTMNAGSPFGRGQTIVGSDCFFMTGSHVAHDCVVGDNVIFANNAVIGGHVEIGSNVMLGGNSAVHQRARIGDHAFVGGMSGLENDLIPYGSCLGDRAELAGLNVVGLQRRGFTRAQIHVLRRAYLALFGTHGTFAERLASVAKDFAGEPAVMTIVDFINADRSRPLCMPRARRPKMAIDEPA
jgi:UDP-N-acetylglucosamine acyltransferase